MTWRDDLARLIDAVPSTDTFAAIGELEAGRARLWARVMTPMNGNAGDGLRCRSADEVAEMLADGDRSWVYRHAEQLGGVKIGGKWLFPEAALRRSINGG